MNTTTVARGIAFILLAGVFGALVWQLLDSAPQGNRARPPAPTPLVDVIDAAPAPAPVRIAVTGTVDSAHELEIRPEVGGRIAAMHREFEPGGRIPAGELLVQIAADDYRLAVSAAQAEIAKARAAITLEQGRRVVAREELDSLKDSLRVDPASQGLALRKPQLAQVQAELAAAENTLQRAELDLARTALRLPYDVLVLERARVAGEVVAARELIGRVTRADTYWVELRVRPEVLARLRARDDTQAGSPVRILAGNDAFIGEVVRIRPELEADSRLAGVIAAVPVSGDDVNRLLLGRYVRAEIDAGEVPDVVRVPRRALQDNNRLWVVGRDGRLAVRRVEVAWESGQSLLLDPRGLAAGDRVVVSRVSGLVPGAEVRARGVDAETGKASGTTQEPGSRG